MSNANLEARVASLENYLAEEQKSLQGSLTATFWVFAALIVIVLGYTLYVTPMLQKATGEEAILEYASGALNSIPSQRAALLANYDENADVWAESAATAIIGQIDALEAPAKSLITNQAEELSAVLEKEIIPTFAEALREQAGDLKEKHKDLSDPAMAEAVVEIFIEVIEEELGEYLNTHLVAKIEQLQITLSRLAKPQGPLTRKQDAERRFLQYWVHLADTLEIGESPFEAVLTFLQQKFGISIKDLTLEGTDDPNPVLTKELDKIEGVGEAKELPKVKP